MEKKITRYLSRSRARQSSTAVDSERDGNNRTTELQQPEPRMTGKAPSSSPVRLVRTG